jgi:hypothetical protein
MHPNEQPRPVSRPLGVGYDQKDRIFSALHAEHEMTSASFRLFLSCTNIVNCPDEVGDSSPLWLVGIGGRRPEPRARRTLGLMPSQKKD